MKYILVLVSILIVSGWFYWFQWRPTEIIKECSQDREEYIQGQIIRSEGSINISVSGVALRYERCLGSKGLR